ncbi:MAG: DNA repair protein RecN [Defluviitaleaceae bacterium]|nr:DNA repair protein RecN [Defluviitaleaceae bacterium]
MLEQLKVKNMALIEEVWVDFTQGLNILAGETGAGKSILIDSINFVLGGKASRDILRKGADVAVVEAFFVIANEENIRQIKSLDIDIDEDNGVLLHRSYSSAGKSVCKVNGKTVPVGIMRNVAACLIDIFGQHEHQTLLDPAKHIKLLDRFCQEELASPKEQLGSMIGEYKDIVKKIKDLTEEDGKDIDFYEFQLEELQKADVKAGEEEELTSRRAVLSHFEKTAKNVEALVNLFYGQGDIVGNIQKANALVKNISQIDTEQEGALAEISMLQEQIRAMGKGFVKYQERLNHDPLELDKIEARLDALYRLKQKYKMGIDQIIAHKGHIEQKIYAFENSQQELDRLDAQKEALKKEIGKTCLVMSKTRKEAASRLCVQIESTLKELGMENATFEMEIERSREFGKDGFDKAQFMISANKGQPLAPLSSVASGGEMSRTMLALKVALAGFDNMETFIFDEIDTGISGRVAGQVAKKLSLLGKTHQILCITHLPQIAAMGDANFLIEKATQDDRTTTSVNKLDEDGTLKEIARLIGGSQITDITLEAAKELRNARG